MAARRLWVGVDAADGPLQHTAGMAGADGSHRLQHRLTTQLEDAEHDALDIAIRALPARVRAAACVVGLR